MLPSGKLWSSPVKFKRNQLVNKAPFKQRPCDRAICCTIVFWVLLKLVLPENWWKLSTSWLSIQFWLRVASVSSQFIVCVFFFVFANWIDSGRWDFKVSKTDVIGSSHVAHLHWVLTMNSWDRQDQPYTCIYRYVQLYYIIYTSIHHVVFVIIIDY